METQQIVNLLNKTQNLQQNNCMLLTAKYQVLIKKMSKQSL